MDESEHQILTSIFEAVSEIRSLMKISTGSAILDVLQNALESDAEQQAYELTDGERTQSQIAKVTGVTQATVSNWWKRWNQLGIIANSSTGRPKKLFDLSTYKMYGRQNSSKESSKQ